MKRRRRLRTTVIALAAAATIAAAPHAPASAYTATETCQFQDARIVESSGLAVVTGNDGAIWTHNDSGDQGRVFAIRTSDCRVMTMVRLRTANGRALKPTDIEDMAKGPDGNGGHALWLGDIGNNNNDPTQPMFVYKLAEPAVGAALNQVLELPQTQWQAYQLQYPDGGHDSETLLAHPVSGRLYVVTKSYTGVSHVYAAPPLAELSTTDVNVLTRVADIVIPLGGTTATTDYVIPVVGALSTTGGDISPDGRRVVIRTYTDAYEWAIGGTTEADFVAAFSRVIAPSHIPLPYSFQGEAIGYTSDSRSLYVTIESAFADQFGRPAQPGRVHRLDP